jgi:tetratricopeptide (TPR) repeat protein
MKEVFVFKRPVFTVMLGLILSVATATVAVSQENPAIKQARQLINNDQPKKAIGVLNDAIKASPADASLLYNLGRALILTGDNKTAELTFQKGIDMNPKEALNVAGKGHLRMVENNVNEAKQFFEQALTATKSKNIAVLNAVAEGYLANDKMANDALNVLLKAKADKDADVVTYLLLGDTYTKLVKGGEAISAYEKAASLDPKTGFPQYKMGLVYLRSKNLAVADEHLTKAVTIEPGCTLAHKELGELYYAQKKAAEAVKAYEAYLALTEFPERDRTRYAFFLFMAKEYKKATPVFKELTSKPDPSILALKYAGYNEAELGNTVEAQKYFDIYFTKAKKEDITASDYNYIAKMRQKAGGKENDSLAVLNYEKSLELDSTQVEIAQTVAESLFKAKRYSESVKAYERLQRLKPKLSSQDLFSMGRAYYVDSLLVKADTTFSRLTVAQPKMTVSWLWLSRTRARLDPESEKGLAKPSFEKLIENALTNPEKNKAELTEAYLYLGYYYFIKNEIPAAKENYKKVLALNPDPKSKGIADEALKAIDNINKPKPAPKPNK